MDRTAHREKICGNLIPLPTPFADDLSLDLDTLRRLVRRMLDAGYRTGNGLFLAGGAGGEFATLRTEERKQVAEAVVEEAGGRIPVVVGIQDTSHQRGLDLARFAQQIGADAIQVGAPYYDPPTVDDILDDFKRISDAVSVPLMVYNTWWTGQNADIGYDGFARCLEIANVGSVKWSSPAHWSYEAVLRDFADQVAIVDNQGCEILAHMMGATAFVSHTPLAWPEFGLRLRDSLQEQRYADALAWIKRFRIGYTALLFKACDYTCSEAGMDKAALAMVGCPVGDVRPPARSLPTAFLDQIRKMLQDAGAPNLQGQ